MVVICGGPNGPQIGNHFCCIQWECISGNRNVEMYTRLISPCKLSYFLGKIAGLINPLIAFYLEMMN